MYSNIIAKVMQIVKIPNIRLTFATIAPNVSVLLKMTGRMMNIYTAWLKILINIWPRVLV